MNSLAKRQNLTAHTLGTISDSLPVSFGECPMQILYINNDGSGFADNIHVDDGTTVAKLFTQRVPHGRTGDYLIRVNRQPATSDQVLQPGDRVSFTPTKIEGA